MNIYQIFTRLYGNQKHLNIPHGTIEQNGSAKLNDFTIPVLTRIRDYGFSHVWFTGLIEHATQTDYTAYGIPTDHPMVVKGQAGSPYAIKDYYDIDPDLAVVVVNRMKEFEELVERTHQVGLKFIIDFVPNHVARQYNSDSTPEGEIPLGKYDRTDWHFSAQNNFYYFPNTHLSTDFLPTPTPTVTPYNEFPARATGNDQFTATPNEQDWYETIKLNYGVDYCGGGIKNFIPIPNTWIRMTNILLFWANKGVDAFRCDMAEMVPVEFWNYAIRHVKKQFPQIRFIAEVYNPSRYREYIYHGGFDFLYDKVGLYDTLRAICCGHQSATAITHAWQAVDDIRMHMLNFLENHDEQRIASEFFCGNVPQKALPAFAVLALMTPAPLMIYAGQEIGERGMEAEGFSGYDGRTTIFDYWSPESLRKLSMLSSPNLKKTDTRQVLTNDEEALYNSYQLLLQIRNEEKIMKEGKFFDLMYVNQDSLDDFNAHKQFTFLRANETEAALVVVNFANETTECYIKIPQHAFDYLQLPIEKITARELITNTEFLLNFDIETKNRVVVPPYGVVVLKFNK